MSKLILLLEDNSHSRAGMAALLRCDGHEVIEVRNALEAQAWIAQSSRPPEIAIVDIDLPGLHGDQWALFLRDLLPETRILFVSGAEGLAGIDRYGPDARFFQKPINVDDFMDAISEEGVESSSLATAHKS